MSYHQDHERQYDHQARVREVLGRKIAALPFQRQMTDGPRA